ncbi:MAG: hypothetical protein JNK66_14675 [Chitinophagales bacterium]|nr:hypothetical protein [Chitinophagales bacterium]
MKNFKINTHQPPLTDADLQSGKDFGSLLKNYQAIKVPFFKTAKFWWGSAGALATVVAAVLLLSKAMTNEHTQGTTAFINPPLPMSDIPRVSYAVNTISDTVILHTSGSRIIIPANAFLDKSGHAINGTVQLHYREFHEISDVFLAGIPMVYDSAGEQFHFETAGMIDITAYNNGLPLFTNPLSPIRVEMVSQNSADRFNTYYLDTSAQQWKYIAQGNFSATSTNADSVATTLSPAQPEADASTKKQNAEIAKVKMEISAILKEKPVEPRKVDKTKSRFTIKVDEKEFPEIAVYSNLKFQPEDKNYDPSKAATLWEDVQLKRVAGTDKYEITFMSSKETYTIIAAPVLEETDYAEAKKVYDKKFEEYTTKLTERKQKEATLQAELEAKAKAADEKIKQEIREMEERRKSYEARLQQTELVYRTFTIQQFGIWNADCPSRLPSGALVAAKFTDSKSGQPITVNQCYLVEKGRNAMYSFTAAGMSRFSFNPKSQNLIWVITNQLKVGVVHQEQFEKNTRGAGAEVRFHLEVIDKKFSSTDEVKEFLGI